MITLKLKYQSDSDFTSLLKEGNKIVRMAFNLFKKRTCKQWDIISELKTRNINYDLVDISMIEFFSADAHDILSSCKKRGQDTVTFGSRKEWKRYHKGLITKEQFNEMKNSRPISFIGRKGDPKGNRKFELDIPNRSIIFKQKRNNHHKLVLQTSSKILKTLEKLQKISETVKTPITYRLSKDHVYVIFDESVLNEGEHEFIENWVASLDLNPNYIALTVQDFKGKDNKKIVHRQVFDLTKLNQTHDTNKTKHELFEVSKTISKICKHFKVEIVGYEKLSMSSKNHNRGKSYNRLLNNTWKRQPFINNLIKNLNILGIKNQEIVAAYSSTVGCLTNPTETDSIAASLEIGRRCFIFKQKFLEQNVEYLDKDVIFPCFDYKKLKERWNSILAGYDPKHKGWKSVHEHLKKQKKLTELRFLFKDYDFSSWSSFRLKSTKSLVTGFSSGERFVYAI